MKTFIQIGTNDGGDIFNALCRQEVPDKIILVEPNDVLNSFIQKNYEGLFNVSLENAAITEVNKGTVFLYLPIESVNERKTKRDIRYGTGNFSLFVPKEWYGKKTSAGRVIEAPSMTFEELCVKHNITDIDFLQIDAEGYDAIIIKSIDFDKYNIKRLQYESTRDWENESVASLLRSKGYKLTKMPEELNVLAIKN